MVCYSSHDLNNGLLSSIKIMAVIVAHSMIGHHVRNQNTGLAFYSDPTVFLSPVFLSLKILQHLSVKKVAQKGISVTQYV